MPKTTLIARDVSAAPAPSAVRVALLAALLFVPALAAEPHEVAPWEWWDVDRAVAIGDLHGSLDKLKQLLEGAELIDVSSSWAGGASHLVVAGDFLDRGPDERAVMDLLMRLQEEARAEGGRVHVLLGNHEVMNLFRNGKYVSPAAYRAFAPDEPESQRVAALRQYTSNGGRRHGDLIAFNRDFPRGHFARQASLDVDGQYGSWLLGLPAVVKIDGVVYVHGGMLEEFAARGIEGINSELSRQLRSHLESRATLEAAGIVTAVMSLGEIRRATEEAMAERRWRTDVREAGETLLATLDSPILGGRGPLWYRGNSFEDERVERASLERSLELLDARALVVAHTPTSGDRITSRFHGQLFRVDHGLHDSHHPLALIAEKGEMLVLDASTREVTEPVRELPPGRSEFYPSPMTDDELQQFLCRARVEQMRPLGRGSTRPWLVELEHAQERQRAVFKTVEEPASSEPVGDRYQHEVAAYLLDRALGFDMVPVTVLREIDGQRGSLQSFVERAIDGEAADSYGLPIYQTEATARQLELAHVFDVLIGNRDRKPADVLRRLDRDRVYLIDHSRAFSASAELDWAGPIGLTPATAASLRALEAGSLRQELGELLDERQLEALIERRDRILERAVLMAGDAPLAPVGSVAGAVGGGRR